MTDGDRPAVPGLGRARFVANPTLTDIFEALWRKAKLPISWAPANRKTQFVVERGDAAAVYSERSEWYVKAGVKRRNPHGPQTYQRITLPHDWSADDPLTFVDGHIILSREERPYTRNGGKGGKRYAVRFIMRTQGWTPTRVQMGQATLKIEVDGTVKFSRTDSRRYE